MSDEILHEDESREETHSSLIEIKQSSTTWSRGLLVDSIMKTWTEVSKINFLSTSNNIMLCRRSSFRTRAPLSTSKLAIAFASRISSYTNKDILIAEEFLSHVTSLLNEDQLWGCFSIYPELYKEMYSPTVQVRNPEDVTGLVSGLLTMDMVSICLSYLKRNPIMGDYVYIKLELKSKHLTNIDVLKKFKYLMYLDLESNYLTNLKVLSFLPYVQFLNVAYNRLDTVLDYDTPQWYLTEVHYKYNSIKVIDDLTVFWSITMLDLSHNNIKAINGLSNLKFLRHLDLSFNHIQRLENLNHLHLVWLDLSYNNISTFELSAQSGLWTLLHLEYINLNENNLTSMKLLSGCIRLKELYARNNRFSYLLELVVFLHPLRRLLVMDLRANPICSTSDYKDVVLDTFPLLMQLDNQIVLSEDQRNVKMTMCPDVSTFSSRGLLRLLYLEQLSRAHVSPHTPPADTTDMPLVVLVGEEGVGKGLLAARLLNECSEHVEQARLHTTAAYISTDYVIIISRQKFDDMLIAGEFLTYTEIGGESYGLSRKEAEVKGGKVKFACMDIQSALMLKLRGRRPFLILITLLDKELLAQKQQERKIIRDHNFEMRALGERSMLQVLISGQIIIRGILNELLSVVFTILALPEESCHNFIMADECSLFFEGGSRRNHPSYINMMNYLSSATTPQGPEVPDAVSTNTQRKDDNSLHSLYKSEAGRDDYTSVLERSGDGKSKKISDASRFDSSKYSRSLTTWKGYDGFKSSKSVTFGSQNESKKEASNHPVSILSINPNSEPEPDASQFNSSTTEKKNARSISCKVPYQPQKSSEASLDLDIWLTFLVENGLLQASEITSGIVTLRERQPSQKMHSSFLKPEFTQAPLSSARRNIMNNYDKIHRNSPGLFWDTVETDDPDKAFRKLKSIIMGIVSQQTKLAPMFDIDFPNLKCYPGVQRKLNAIRKQIAPQRLFY